MSVLLCAQCRHREDRVPHPPGACPECGSTHWIVELQSAGLGVPDDDGPEIVLASTVLPARGRP